MQSSLSILLAVLSTLAILLVVRAAYRLGARRAQRAAGDLTAINEIGVALLRARLSVDDCSH